MNLKRSWTIVGCLLPFFFGTSCGKFLDQFSRLKNGFTEIKIGNASSQGLHANVVVNGGIMVYMIGRNVSHQEARYFPDIATASASTFFLPNGDYDMVAIAYETKDAAGNGMQGPAHCGGVSPDGQNSQITLSGGTQTVAFTLSTATCAKGAINAGTFDATYGLPPVDLVSCGTGTLSGQTPSSNCVSSPAPGTLHSLRSAQLSMVTYISDPASGNFTSGVGVQGPCIVGAGTQSFSTVSGLSSVTVSGIYAISGNSVLVSGTGTGLGTYLLTANGSGGFSISGPQTSGPAGATSFAGDSSHTVAAVSGTSTLYYSSNASNTSSASWSTATVTGGSPSSFTKVIGGGSTFMALDQPSGHLYLSNDGGQTYNDKGVPGGLAEVDNIDLDILNGSVAVAGLTHPGNYVGQILSGKPDASGNLTFTAISASNNFYNAVSAPSSIPFARALRSFNGNIVIGTAANNSGMWVLPTVASGSRTWSQFCYSTTGNCAGATSILPSDNVKDIWGENNLLYVAAASDGTHSGGLTVFTSPPPTSNTANISYLSSSNVNNVITMSSGGVSQILSNVNGTVQFSNNHGNGNAISSGMRAPVFGAMGPNGIYPWTMRLDVYNDTLCNNGNTFSSAKQFFLSGGLSSVIGATSGISLAIPTSSSPSRLFIQ